ncbi:Ig-like domain-containing protein [Pontibacter beigongshangensis]|uniref:Ig-like domain-containing protein n=1 Tax=Pontibacter beigongshangensis TaxID=2574733 RepID=UPI00165049EB|nr:gliding motility-associated C-terminal domain-containing protein [Pontibacter beigongshangensis]
MLSLILTLCILVCNKEVSAQQNCEQVPDASLTNPYYNFTYCTPNISTATFTLAVENTSATKANNASYHLSWGDGSSNSFGKDFDKTSHVYRAAGTYDLVLTVTGENGCTERKTEQVFVGSNPGIGLSNLGNSTDCAPATYRFDVNSFERNSPFTVYTFTFDDGTPTITLSHAELLAKPYIEHTFNESSQDKPGGFTLTALASNPCLTSKSTWSGIRISKGPVADIGLGSKTGCVNQPITLSDVSNSGYDASRNLSTHRTEWTIAPATGWYIQSGNVNAKKPVVVFTEPGEYVVKLAVSPEDANSTCAGSTKEEVIKITTPPTADFSLTQLPENKCVPGTFTVTNTSAGENILHAWAVTKADGTAATGWSFTGGTTASSREPKFSINTPGTYNVVLTASNGCSPNSTKSIPVTVAGKPVVTLPKAPAPYCGTTNITFSADNTKHTPVYQANFGTITGYKWEVKVISGAGEGSFVNNTSTSSQYPTVSLTASESGPVVYEIWAYAMNECGETSAPAKQRITINPLPDVKITAPKAEICIGEEIILTASGASSYKWQAAAGLNATTGSKVTVKPTKTTTYTVTGTNSATGCTSTTTFTVVVKPLPTITVNSSSADICLGQGAATLTASGAASYSWQPATGLSATTGAEVTASPKVTTTYTVTGIDEATGCSNTATVTVTVKPLPQVEAGPNQTVCDNPEPIKLLGQTAGGTWSGPHVTDGYFLPAGKGEFVLRYTYTDASGCTNFDEMTMTVTEALVANAGDDREVCLNSGSFAMQASPAGGIWSGSELISKDGTFTPSKTGTYTLTYTYYTGTCFTSDQAVVTVKSLPGTPAVVGATICYGTSATLTAENPEGTILWYDESGQQLHTGTAFATGPLTSTTKYLVETLANNGCSSSRLEVTVVVRPQTPAPSVDPVTLCGSGKATLTAIGTAEVYNWYSQEGTLLHSGKTFTPTVETTSVFLAEGAIAGCVGPRTQVQVTVLPKLALNELKGVPAICAGQTPATITGTVPEGGNGTYTFRWESSLEAGSGYTVINEATAATYTPNALTRSTYFRRVVISGACTDYSSPVLVTVTPIITNNILISGNTSICEGGTAPELKGEKPAGGSGEYEYLWESSVLGTVDGFEPAAGIHNLQHYSPGTLTQTTWFRRMVRSGTCQEKISEQIVKITIDKPITANSIAGDPVVCAVNASTITLIGSQPSGGNGEYMYKWEVSTDGENFTVAPGQNHSANYTPSFYNQILWYRRVVTAGPCAASTSEAVKVLPALTNNIVRQSQTVCIGDAFQPLTATTPVGGTNEYSFRWESSTTGEESDFRPAAGENTLATYTAPKPLESTTFFRRIVSSGPCALNISTPVKIMVQPAIAGFMIITPEQTICAGEAPGLLIGDKPTGGDNTFTYLWESSTDGITFTDAAGANTAISYQAPKLENTTWFRRRAASGQCFAVSDAVRVVVNEAITENVISEPQVICFQTAPQPLLGSDPKGSTGEFAFQWQVATSGNNGPFADIAGATARDYAPGVLSTTTWYRRVVTSGACSRLSEVVQITVSPVISRNTIAFAQNIYAGQKPAPLTGSQPIGGSNKYTYAWESSTEGPDAGFGPVYGIRNDIHYAPQALTQTTWFRRIVRSGGCEDISAAFKITVIPDVNSNIVQAGQTICYGNKPAPLTGTTPGGGEGDYLFLWQASTKGATVGFVTAAGASGARDYAPDALTQDTWFRRVVISGPFTDTSTAVLITVKPVMANNRISSSQTICYGTTPTTLTGSVPTGGSGSFSYLWESSTTGPDKGFTTATGDNTKPSYSPGELTRNTWYRRVVSSEACDKLVSDVVAITINPLPKAPKAENVGICYNSRAELKASGSGGNLEWFTAASGGSPIYIGAAFTTPVLTATTTYFVQEVALSCAGERKAVTVTVTSPTADAGPDVTFIKGRNATLHASGGDTYSWSPAIGLNNPKVASPIASPEVTTTYTVTVTTNGGCVSTDEVTVTVLPAVDIPNTFTPNSDGINDNWEIPHLTQYANCQVQVFNQWGTLVFTSQGYKAPWDGRFNGQELPLATYYYIIRLDDKEKPLAGSVTIVK